MENQAPGTADARRPDEERQHNAVQTVGVFCSLRGCSSIMHGYKAIPPRLPVNGLMCRVEKDKKTKESRERESGKGTEELVTTRTRSRVHVGMDSVQNSLMNRLDEGKQTLLTVGPANQNRVRYFGQVSSYDFQAKICCLEEKSLSKKNVIHL